MSNPFETYELKEDKLIYPVLNNNNVLLQDKDIQDIFQSVGLKHIVLHDLQIYQKAFIHKSYMKYTDFIKNEKYFGNIDGLSSEEFPELLPLQEESNEVWEWLGDAMLQSISAIYLYQRYGTNQNEGFLTKLRSKIVKTETLSKLSASIQFHKYMVISKHVEKICQGRSNERILEDCFEAFIGALMVDQGNTNPGNAMNIIYNFMSNIIQDNLDLTELIIHDDNFKDQLMRYFHKEFYGKFPVYDLIDSDISVNKQGITTRNFIIEIKDIYDNIIGTGNGKSKKEAEQKAAQNALHYYGIFDNVMLGSIQQSSELSSKNKSNKYQKNNENNASLLGILNENNHTIELQDIQDIFNQVHLNHVRPKNLEYYQQAFIHKSYVETTDFEKNKKLYGNPEIDNFSNIFSSSSSTSLLPLQKDSNEVMEWIGDAVLQSVSGLYLFKRYGDDQKEGFLTRIRSKIVKTESLSKLATSLGMDKHLMLSKHFDITLLGRNNHRVLEDCFESFLGAMLLDFSNNLQDIDIAFNIIYDFFRNAIEENINLSEIILNDDNYKDQLMRYFHKEFDGQLPVYETIDSETTNTNDGKIYHKFTVCVKDLNNQIIGKAYAKSIKDAQQRAAQYALQYYGIFNGY